MKSTSVFLDRVICWCIDGWIPSLFLYGTVRYSEKGFGVCCCGTLVFAFEWVSCISSLFRSSNLSNGRQTLREGPLVVDEDGWMAWILCNFGWVVIIYMNPTRHLLLGRFWGKVMKDMSFVLSSLTRDGLSRDDHQADGDRLTWTACRPFVLCTTWYVVDRSTLFMVRGLRAKALACTILTGNETWVQLSRTQLYTYLTLPLQYLGSNPARPAEVKPLLPLRLKSLIYSWLWSIQFARS